MYKISHTGLDHKNTEKAISGPEEPRNQDQVV